MKRKGEIILVGLLAGMVSGIFAAGGGMIVLPALLHIFKIEDSKARATTIFTLLPIVITSGILYYKNDYINWNMGIKCAIGGVIGGAIGAKILKKISKGFLRKIFIVLLAYTSIKMMIG